MRKDPAVAPPLSFISRVRAAEGYDRAVRKLGCGWFLLLAAVAAQRASAHSMSKSIADLAPPDWADLLVCICLIFIYLAFSWAILNKASSVAHLDGLMPSLTAFVGTYLPWSFVLFAADQDPKGQNPISVMFLVAGTVAAVVVISYLGKSFSIVPEARRLVREGPYSFIRNPLYLVEELALIGFLLRFFSPVTLALFIVHGVLQVARILFEENLLRRTFPDYDDYSRSTARLIPYVW